MIAGHNSIMYKVLPYNFHPKTMKLPSPTRRPPAPQHHHKTKRDDGQEKSKECLERMPRAELMQDIENSFGLTNVLI